MTKNPGEAETLEFKNAKDPGILQQHLKLPTPIR